MRYLALLVVALSSVVLVIIFLLALQSFTGSSTGETKTISLFELTGESVYQDKKDETHKPVCGNGIIEIGERCDDGNVLGGDGCSSFCDREPIIIKNDDGKKKDQNGNSGKKNGDGSGNNTFGQQSQQCNYNGVCDIGENKTNCGADCYLDYYLKFFQIRYNYSDTSAPEPIFKNKNYAQLVIGFPYGNLDHYVYANVESITGNENASTDVQSNAYYKNFIVALSDSEVLALFNGKQLLPKDILQREDIQKLYILNNPGQQTLDYGVQLNPDGSVYLDPITGYAVHSNSVQEYLDGTTIIVPSLYNDQYRTRFNFNFENPTVREYLWRYAEKIALSKQTENVFIDNVFVSNNILPYVKGSDNGTRAVNYATNYDLVLNELKIRNYNIIINGPYWDFNGINMPLADYIIANGHFDGAMFENRFNGCSWINSGHNGLCPLKDINSSLSEYINWIRILKQNGKIALFTSGEFSFFSLNDPNPYRIWLWVHLVAQDNTYFYMNDDYSHLMLHYPFYDNPLGQPLDAEAVWDPINGEWKRKYEKGTIVFKPGWSAFTPESAGSIELV